MPLIDMSTLLSRFAKAVLPDSTVRTLKAAARQHREEQARRERLRRFGRDAVMTLPVRSFSELFTVDPHGGVVVPAARIDAMDSWELPLAELMVLAGVVQALRPQQIFEIGTYTGASTLLLALNAPAEAEITTLDLDPATRDAYFRSIGETRQIRYELGNHFRDGPWAGRIHQRLGDARNFDYAPYEARMDLVYVDASHDYSQVRHDSLSAMRMLRPGGVVVWDDYKPVSIGVIRALQEIALEHPLYHIEGTRLATYRKAPENR
ncbi:MAG TPA: class I SAM-dependent methyltransferase [Solimonas sp.]|nr:class I SAM-dependent methyltransferase [Solimonas sp.]